MKSAKEMFEELGFILTINNDRYIRYYKVFKEDDYTECVRFDLYYKLLSVSASRFEELCEYDIQFCVIKAIHKQLEELGWLE